MSAARNIAQFVGKRITPEEPRMDARLPDGSRVHVVLPPCARCGVVVSIRKFSKSSFSIDNLIEYGSVTEEGAQFIRACVLLHKNIVVSGGTSSGKTSLLNALSAVIPEGERIIVIEDSSELQFQQPHVVQLAFIFSARSATNYASFCAARTAVSWYGEEEIEGQPGEEFALDMAHRAATLACVSVAEPGGGAISKLLTSAGLAPKGADNLFKDFAGWSIPSNWAKRYVSSYAATRVTFVNEDEGKVPTGQPLTAQVVHWYRLRVPIANKLLGFKVWAFPDSSGNGLHMVAVDMAKIKYYSKAFGANVNASTIGRFALPGYYMPITASCTLDVE